MFETLTMIASHYRGVIKVDEANRRFPWRRQDLELVMKQRTKRGVRRCFGFVAKDEGMIVGFVIHEHHGDRMEVLNLQVLEAWRRQGVATELLERTLEAFDRRTERCRKIIAVVPDSCFPGRMFFKSQGWTANGVERNAIPEVSEDGYRFEWRRYSANKFHHKNRLKGLA
jgi:ribosomal protein S18 acetylase RimI-like enzyme